MSVTIVDQIMIVIRKAIFFPEGITYTQNKHMRRLKRWQTFSDGLEQIFNIDLENLNGSKRRTIRQ